ncbi:hypothetical protein DIPPA_09813 [Diplonema papillatum]|nr:hypothetical protein DIPPA_09813 [Diplonema papillatum]
MAANDLPRKEEKVEQDTDAGENEIDLMQLLLPDGSLNNDHQNFSLSFNRSALKGWVKQGSPVCAASSLAGAWNTVWHLERTAAKAESQHTMLDVLRDIVREMQRKAEESIARTLLVDDMAAVLSLIKARVEKQGKTVGGRKDEGATPADCTHELKQHCVELVLANPQAPETEAERLAQAPKEIGMPENVFASLIDAWELHSKEQARAFSAKLDADKAARDAKKAEKERLKQLAVAANASRNTTPVGAPPPATQDGGGGQPQADGPRAAIAALNPEIDEDEEDKELEEDDDNEEEEVLISDVPVGKKTARKPGGKKKAAGAADAKKNLAQLVNAGLSAWLRPSIGLAKLEREPHPSTGAIGNWGLIKAIQKMNERLPAEAESVSIRTLLSRCGTTVHKVKATDPPDVVATQWYSLCNQFDRPNSCVIFHHTNHYSLIFALRSWLPAGSDMPIRQVLTARKGQRPNTWYDFNECRAIVASWGGYKLLHVSRPQQNQPASDANADQPDGGVVRE